MLLFKKDFATISLAISSSLITLKWLQQPTEEEFKEVFRTCLEAARSYGVKNILSYNMIGMNMNLSVQHWTAAYGAELYKDLKVERYARVLPQDALQEVVSYKMYDRLQQILPNSMEFKIFHDEKEAKKWLLQRAQHQQ